jgi:hypothetical protein
MLVSPLEVDVSEGEKGRCLAQARHRLSAGAETDYTAVD